MSEDCSKNLGEFKDVKVTIGGVEFVPKPVLPPDCSGVHCCQSLRGHMRQRELILRSEADKLHGEGAFLDAQARKMIADELDGYCSMLNRLESEYARDSQIQTT